MFQAIDSALIESTGPLELVRTCFVDNLVTTSPAITYQSSFHATGNFQQQSEGTICPLAVSFVPSHSSSESPDPTCKSFDASTCMSLDPHHPTQPPTQYPTTRPTLRPSGSPTRVPTGGPTSIHSSEPSPSPTVSPSTSPTAIPSSSPSTFPSDLPSVTITSAEEFSVESVSKPIAVAGSLFLCLFSAAFV